MRRDRMGVVPKPILDIKGSMGNRAGGAGMVPSLTKVRSKKAPAAVKPVKKPDPMTGKVY